MTLLLSNFKCESKESCSSELSRMNECFELLKLKYVENMISNEIIFKAFGSNFESLWRH